MHRWLSSISKPCLSGCHCLLSSWINVWRKWDEVDQSSSHHPQIPSSPLFSSLVHLSFLSLSLPSLSSLSLSLSLLFSFSFSLLLFSFQPHINYPLFPLPLHLPRSLLLHPPGSQNNHPAPRKKDDHPIYRPRPVPARVPRPPRNNRMEPERTSHRPDGYPAFTHRGRASRIALIAVRRNSLSEK